MTPSVITFPSVQPKPEIRLFEDASFSSSREEIGASEVWDKPSLTSREIYHYKSIAGILNLWPILLIDYSSSIYGSFESRSETALTDEVFRKLRQKEILENVSGMLNELNPVQMEIFEAAVKRRPLFK